MTFGPAQPSRHSRPLAASIVTATRVVSFWVGTVPGRKYSDTVSGRERPGFQAGERVDLGRDEALRRPLELGDLLALADLGQDRRPERGGRVERELAVVGRVVAVAHPDTDRERRRLLVGRRGDEAVGRDVAVVARRAGLVGGRAAGLAVVDRPLAPERVDLLVGVAGEDVGHDVGGPGADDAGALGRGLGRRPDDLAVRVEDRADDPARHQHAAVGDRAVCAEQVDRMDLERPDAHRQDRHGRLRDRSGRIPGSARRRGRGRS